MMFTQADTFTLSSLTVTFHSMKVHFTRYNIFDRLRLFRAKVS